MGDLEVFHPETAALEGQEVHVFGETETRADIVYKLSQYIPLNEFGLPIFFLRSDLLHGTTISSDDVDAASVGLFYYDGFPALENGQTFWNQLPHEPYHAFELFQKYCEQPEETGIRQLDLLSAESGVEETTQQLSQYVREFYWSQRARAYDLFLVAAEAKKRQLRIRKMENSHYKQSEQLFAKLMDRFTGENEDWIDELNAKEAIEVLETLVKIQRMSVGLVGQHASSSNKDFGEADSGETMIRKLAQGAGMSQGGTDRFAQSLQSLLDDPENGATIQAAVIKVTAGNNRNTFNEDM